MMINKQFSFIVYIVIGVGNDALLPTQNTITRVGKFESRGGKVKKKSVLPRRTLSLPTLLKIVPAPML